MEGPCLRDLDPESRCPGRRTGELSPRPQAPSDAGEREETGTRCRRGPRPRPSPERRVEAQHEAGKRAPAHRVRQEAHRRAGRLRDRAPAVRYGRRPGTPLLSDPGLHAGPHFRSRRPSRRCACAVPLVTPPRTAAAHAQSRAAVEGAGPGSGFPRLRRASSRQADGIVQRWRVVKTTGRSRKLGSKGNQSRMMSRAGGRKSGSGDQSIDAGRFPKVLPLAMTGLNAVVGREGASVN